MIVRELEERDCENLSALSILVYLSTYAKDGIRDNISRFVLNAFSPDKFRKILKSLTVRCFLAISNQHIVGVVIINLESKFQNSSDFGYEIETLYVHPNFQGTGVGQAFLKYLNDNLGKKSWLTTWVHNHKAIRFYKKSGYRIIGDTEFILFDESHKNHVFTKS